MKFEQLLCCIVGTLSAAVSSVDASAVPLSWRKLSGGDAGPDPRTRAGLGFDGANNRLVLFGGTGSLSDTWSFNLSTNKWEAVSASSVPQGRFSYVYGSTPNEFIVHGGESRANKKREFLNDIWRFSFTTNEWSKDPDTSMVDPPGGRYGSAGGVVLGAGGEPGSGLVIVSHGFAKGDGRYDDTFEYNLATKQWKEVSPDVRPTARCLGPGAVTTGSTTDNYQLTMFGGCGSGGYGPCPSADTHIFSGGVAEESGLWSQGGTYCHKAALNSVMFGIPASADNTTAKHVLLFGGSFGGVGNSNDGEVAVLQTRTGVWRTFTPKCDGSTCPKQTGGYAVATGTDAVYLYGPEDSSIWELSGDFDKVYGIEGKGCGERTDFRKIHGAFMFVSWGVLLPLGVTASRFREFIDGHGKWFMVHRFCQISGVILMTVGFVMAMFINQIAKFLAQPHAIIGLVVVALGLQQPINAYFRPHVSLNPGESKTGKRIFWEYFHKGGGYIAVILGLLQPFWGFAYLGGSVNNSVDATHPTMGFIMYSMWVGALVTIWIFLSFKQQQTVTGKKPVKAVGSQQSNNAEQNASLVDS